MANSGLGNKHCNNINGNKINSEDDGKYITRYANKNISENIRFNIFGNICFIIIYIGLFNKFNGK